MELKSVTLMVNSNFSLLFYPHTFIKRIYAGSFISRPSIECVDEILSGSSSSSFSSLLALFTLVSGSYCHKTSMLTCLSQTKSS